ncbi:hypothetical protein NA78x_003406 [Anatilimnocola sp. NA78]|uniref:hypothetical protein n=1 Tax=Anatilimnocola sp. NA78 TaxID=3415683 RepID=UPI003CE5302B
MFRRSIIIVIAVVFVALVLQRIWRYAAYAPQRPTMPAMIADETERELFQSAGGKYTLADITANGTELPSQKYRGFRAVHDLQPQPGDRLCPITRTKANLTCTWIVDGQAYAFCCPPCIPEFVRLAKERPRQIRPADTFVAGKD